MPYKKMMIKRVNLVPAKRPVRVLIHSGKGKSPRAADLLHDVHKLVCRRAINLLTAQQHQAIGGIQRANSLTQQRRWHLSGDGLVPRSVGEFTHQAGHDSPEKRVCDTSPMNPPASKHLSVNSATCGLMRITLDARVP